MATILSGSALYAALSEQIYRRFEGDEQLDGTVLGGDQALQLNNSADDAFPAGLEILQAESEANDFYVLDRGVPGLEIDGFYYVNPSTGFVGAIIEAGTGNYIVVFRGTDFDGVSLPGDFPQLAIAAFGGDFLIDPEKIDPGDVFSNVNLGGGIYDQQSQLEDALALARYAISLAGGDPYDASNPDNQNVTVTGHSLGGGLAGVAGLVLGTKVEAFGPAPFDNQLKVEADITAVEDVIADYPGLFTSAFFALSAGEKALTLRLAVAGDPATFGGSGYVSDPGQVEDLLASFDQAAALTLAEYEARKAADFNVYSVSGEFTTNRPGYTSAIGNIIDGFSSDFVPDNEIQWLDVGEMRPGEEFARHSPALNALLLGSVAAGESLAITLNQDSTLRHILFDQAAIAAPVTSGKISGVINDPSAHTIVAPSVEPLFRALWKSIYSDTPADEEFFRYFHDFFTDFTTAGAASDGHFGGEAAIADKSSLHTGVLKLSLQILRDALQNTNDLAAFQANLDSKGLTYEFAGDVASNGFIALDRRSITPLGEALGTDADAGDLLTEEVAGERQAFGVRDINSFIVAEIATSIEGVSGFFSLIVPVLTGRLDTFTEATLGVTVNGVLFGDSVLGGWEKLIVQAGVDGQGLNFSVQSSPGDLGVGHVIIGGSGDDTIEGGDGDDYILTSVGVPGDQFDRDTIRESDGHDVILGGAGTDTYVASGGVLLEDSEDVFIGGTGWDIADYSEFGPSDPIMIAEIDLDHQDLGYFGFTVTDSDGNVDRHYSVEGVTGTQGDDVVNLAFLSSYGGDAPTAVRLDGQGGDDSLVGGLGQDTLIGGLGRDTLTGGAGADTFWFTLDENAATDVTSSSAIADARAYFEGLVGGTDIGYASLHLNFTDVITDSDADDRILINGVALHGGEPFIHIIATATIDLGAGALLGAYSPPAAPPEKLAGFGNLAPNRDAETNALLGVNVEYLFIGADNYVSAGGGTGTPPPGLEGTLIIRVESTINGSLDQRTIVVHDFEQGDLGIVLGDVAAVLDNAIIPLSVAEDAIGSGPDANEYVNDDYYDFYDDKYDGRDDSILNGTPSTESPAPSQSAEDVFVADNGAGSEVHDGGGINGRGASEVDPREGGETIVIVSLGGGGSHIEGSYFGDNSATGPLEGTNLADLILGNDGNDRLFGEAGGDTLEGGRGRDFVYGGDGADRIIDGAGDDLAYGEAGDDTILGGAGKDLYDGGEGRDTLILEGALTDYLLVNRKTLDIAGPIQFEEFTDGRVAVIDLRGAADDDLTTGELSVARSIEAITFDDGGVIETRNLDGPLQSFIYRSSYDEYLARGALSIVLTEAELIEHLGYTIINNPGGLTPDIVAIVAQNGGTITRVSDTSWQFDFESAATALGEITIFAQDGAGSFTESSLQIIQPDTPPVAAADAFSFTFGGAVSISANALLTNDTDPEDGDFSVIGVAAGTNGTVTFDNGVIRLTTAVNFSGVASFEYTIEDETGAQSVGLVNVTFSPPVLPSPESGGAGADFLLGDNTSNHLRGEGGDDLLIGLDGVDGLFGGDGADVLHGWNGADILDGGPGADVLIGDRGDKVFYFGVGYGVDVVINDFQNSDDSVLRILGVALGDLEFSLESFDAPSTYRDGAFGDLSQLLSEGYDPSADPQDALFYLEAAREIADEISAQPPAETDFAGYLDSSNNGGPTEFGLGIGLGEIGSDSFAAELGIGGQSLGDEALVISIRGTDDQVIIPLDLLDDENASNSPDGGVHRLVLDSGVGLDLRLTDTAEVADALGAILAAGTDGDDRLFGSQGNATLDGGLGDDLMIGRHEATTYRFNLGDGDDLIDERGYLPLSYNSGPANPTPIDAIEFGAGVTFSDLSFSLGGLYGQDLKITISDTGETITIKDQFVLADAAQQTGSSPVRYVRIETLKFSDGSSFSWLAGGAPDHMAINAFLAPLVVDRSGENVVRNSSAVPVAILDGGGGDDVLIGGAGADIYAFGIGRGSDIVADTASDEFGEAVGDPALAIDVVRLGAGIGQSHISFSRGGIRADDLVIDIDVPGQAPASLTILSHFNYALPADLRDPLIPGDPIPYRIERVEFADGTFLTWQMIETMAFDLTNAENQIVGGASSDILKGTVWADFAKGLAGNDRIETGRSADTIEGGDGDDTLEGGSGADDIGGGAGVDTATYLSSLGSVRIVLTNTALNEGDAIGDTIRADIEAIEGSVFDDSLQGNASNNTFRGSDGADTLLGAFGDDTLFGDRGDDVLVGGAGADSLNGGDGFDIASYAGGAAIRVALWDPSLNTGDAAGDIIQFTVETVEGSAFADNIQGNSNNNELRGGAGIDLILGGFGDDTLVGGAGADDMGGGAGFDIVSYIGSGAVRLALWSPSLNSGDAAGDNIRSDVEAVLGSEFSDTLEGSASANDLRGSHGNDRILGGGGDDTLSGEFENDTLEGGGGNDIFVFAKEGGADRITDFVEGSGIADVIRIEGFGAAFDSYSEVIAVATQVGADVRFDFGNGDTLTVVGAMIAGFNANDFAFG